MESVKILEKFFEYDMICKIIINDIIPNELDFYSDDTRLVYKNKLYDNITKLYVYINKMMKSYEVNDNVILKFNDMIKKINEYINSPSFDILLKKDYYSFLKFIDKYITDMRTSFVYSIKKGFFGDYLDYGYGVIMPNTINEFLHYIHSFVINNDKIYKDINILKNKDTDDRVIYLRGIETMIGNALYNKILLSCIDSSIIDIINLDNKIIIMARDLGHSTLIEIDTLDLNNIYVKYFIPKNTDREKTGLLKGINENNNEFATGNFKTNVDNLTNDISTLMLNIPRDRGVIGSYLK